MGYETFANFFQLFEIDDFAVFENESRAALNLEELNPSNFISQGTDLVAVVTRGMWLLLASFSTSASGKNKRTENLAPASTENSARI